MSAARFDKFARIFSFNSGLAPLEGHRPLRVVDVFQERLKFLAAKGVEVVEDEHQPADLFHELGVFPRQVFQQAPLRGAVDDVEHVGHIGHAARLLELLADDARHAVLQAALDVLNNLRAGLTHRRHAADYHELALGRQTLDDLRRLLGMEVREDQGDRLRMLVHDER